MKTQIKTNFPPNPFKRSPIRRREELAGRAVELKTIQYYLNLTVAGQSPHLALIGQRGVGKTSLLNGAESIAVELKLLPVRLDMNELKANSQGRFWHDLYQTLALSMVRVGCWGGVEDGIYSEILRMLHARQPGSLKHAVLQVPYVFSCHQGPIEGFECPDSLVVNDFQACLAELKRREYFGIALLIDEADCLGKNVSLLQMFRNIFQVVDSCSLILAGTDAVFPAISEVFSPIPRQFHRVEVKPFTSWTDTFDLVYDALSEKVREAIAPQMNSIEELHDLCGGAPDEIQLYCHHMYRSVENGSSSKMALAPRVFREVLREYRTNSPANTDKVLNAVERLPDKLLFESKWVSRRKLTREENICVSILSRELRSGAVLSQNEREKIASDLTEGYHELYEAGLTETEERLDIVGSPLTSGFWKSFVEVERSNRWAWDDASFGEQLRRIVTGAIAKDINSLATLPLQVEDKSRQAIDLFRSGVPLKKEDEGVREITSLVVISLHVDAKHAADVTLHMETPAGRQSCRMRYIERLGDEICAERIQNWVVKHKSVLAASNIELEIEDFVRWEVPTKSELAEIGQITGSTIIRVIGATVDMDRAVAKFVGGDIQGCATDFEEMLKKKEMSSIRNNLGFCQILLGQIEEAIVNLTLALELEYEPLYELNKAIGQYLQGNPKGAGESLDNALKIIQSQRERFDPTAVRYVLLLEPSDRRVWYHTDLPVDAAIWINLWRMNAIAYEDMKKGIAETYPEEASIWLAQYAEEDKQ